MSQDWNFVINYLARSAVLSANNTNIASTRLCLPWGWVEGGGELIMKVFFLEAQSKKQDGVCVLLYFLSLLQSTWTQALVHRFCSCCVSCWINDPEVGSFHLDSQSCPWKSEWVLCQLIPIAWLYSITRRGLGTFKKAALKFIWQQSFGYFCFMNEMSSNRRQFHAPPHWLF